MIIRKNKSKWEVVGDDGKHVYGSFKTKRDAIQKCICLEKNRNLCRSPNSRLTIEQIKEEVLRNIQCVE